MSYVTTADHHLYDAKHNIREAIKHLSSIRIEECSGSEEFTEAAKAIQMEALFKLIELREKL